MFGKCVLQRPIVTFPQERFGLELRTPSPNLHLPNLWAEFAASFRTSGLASVPGGAANCSHLCVRVALQPSFFYPRENSYRPL